jgi:hypothetical protein
MPFEPLRTVRGGGGDDQRLCPAVQADGTPVWEAGDSNVVTWPATGLGSCHGALGNQRNHLKIRAHVFLTDSRLVVVSGQFAKGSRHSGPLISSAVKNQVSQTRAEREAAGQFLAGQMRHPWISLIVYSRRNGLRGENAIRVCGTHVSAFGDREAVMLLIHLDAGADPGTIAAEMASRVVADRYDCETTTAAERESLAAARFTDPGEAAAGTLPSIQLAGAYVVSASSCGHGVHSSRSAGAAPAASAEGYRGRHALAPARQSGTDGGQI